MTLMLPEDVESLKALVLAERAKCDAMSAETERIKGEIDRIRGENDRMAAQNEKLRQILLEMRRARFGKRSERLDADQLALALEELEAAFAAEAGEPSPEVEKEAPARERKQAPKRKPLPAHLPRIEEVIEPETKTCGCCGGELHRIGEDVSERLDKVPAQLRVLVTRRPRYGCRACETAVTQAPAVARLVRGGLPTEALVADVLVSKYAWHLPLYRQAQIYEGQGIDLDRSILAHWVGLAAAELKPLHQRLTEILKTSEKLFADETRCPVLDPGRGRTKTGWLWSIARDDRPWGGTGPPIVIYSYAPGRGAEHAEKLLAGFSGVLQVDGYAAYRTLIDPQRKGGPATLAFCWAHVRRKLYDIAHPGPAPIAEELLLRIAWLYEVEAEIRGRSAEDRRAVRQARSKPQIEALNAKLEETLARVPGRSALAEAIRYALSRWEGLCRFLDDGRIELDSNVVERGMRGIALNRKNALFAGHDRGAEAWATIASFIETAKLNGAEPQPWLADTLTKLVNLWPMSRIDELMPWAYAARR